MFGLVLITRSHYVEFKKINNYQSRNYSIGNCVWGVCLLLITSTVSFSEFP